MMHTPTHPSTPIQTFHQPRTPPKLFFLWVGKPHKIMGKPFSHQPALIFYQLLNHLSVHDDVEATLKLVRSAGKGALDPWNFLFSTLLEMTFGRVNWITGMQKVQKVLGRNIHTYHNVYIYIYMYGHICMLYNLHTHTLTSIHVYIYIYIDISKFSLLSEVFY